MGTKKGFGKTKKILTLMMAAVFFVTTFTACGSGKNATSDCAVVSNAKYETTEGYGFASSTMPAAAQDVSYDASYSNGDYDYTVSDIELGENTLNANTGRKLIKNANLELETKEYDDFISYLEKEIEAVGGYVESVNRTGASYNRNYRSAYYVIRVPEKNYDAFLGAVSDNASVVRIKQTATDITESYVDVESHIKVLRIEQDKLLELLNKATYLEDIITLEQRLTNVRYEIERYEQTLRAYQNQVSYSTVTMNVEEVEIIIPVSPRTMGDRIGSGFRETIHDIVTGFQNFIVWFIVDLPYFIVWGAIIALIAFIIVKIVKTTDRKRTDRVEKRKQESDKKLTDNKKDDIG